MNTEKYRISMIRRVIVAVVGLALRIYFQRIEVTGVEHVPLNTPVIFVLNHPNALVDPVFLFSLAPRPVSFLAKAPLFHMPIIGYLVKALDSLPVYRRQDEGEDVSKNQETFVAARKLLARGGTIGICPEGVSHDAPGLKPIKTGAARISLAAVSTGEVSELKIVPAGLYYTSKTRFRSDALLYFGNPIAVAPVQLEPDGTPPRDAVRQLSSQIEKALREVILDAKHEEELQTTARAERIFSSASNGDGEPESLKDELRLQQRFIKAYPILQSLHPERLRRLELRMLRFEAELNQAGVDTEELSPPRSTMRVAWAIIRRTILFLLMLGPALIGTVTHYPAYKLGGLLATRLSRDSDDIISTIKIISALLLFPLTWIILTVLGYVYFGWLVALLALVVIPFCGYAAILFYEELDKSIAGLRVLTFFLVERRFFVRLLAERNAIRDEIIALGKETPAASE
ncbi:MAG TPA: lysophospholipid acyltransferase family protein [Pyrinomonadaceae bacterium]|jgi:1-acyl-sn-glycerol-3-phosphate acyltransferase|nr:lysophospholipid acyltransferase family protein [Pyrinomonadaceae bacterium]